MKWVLSAIAALALPSNAIAGPIWEKYPQLICRAGATFFCSDGKSGCDRDEAKWVIQINFSSNSYKYTSSARTGKILNKIYTPYAYDPGADGNVILLDGGTLVTFLKPRAASEPYLAPEIPAVAQSAPVGSVADTFMSCHPAGL